MIKYILPFIVFFQSHIFACDCPVLPSLEESIESSKFIFLAQIISEELVCYELRDTGWVLISEEAAKENLIVLYYKELKINVQDYFKREIGDEIKFITTPVASTACGYDFNIGSKYIIFSDDDIDNNYILVNKCNRIIDYKKKEKKKITRYTNKKA